MQPPYESESGLAPSLVADANSWPQPPHFGRLYGSSLRRVFRTASGCVLFCLVPGGYVVSKPVIPPESEKPARKSTRLNSSHQIISYALFCLKKKKKTNSGCPFNLSTGFAVSATRR